MKAYLKCVYDVDSLHVRSTVIQHKVERIGQTSLYSYGRLARPKSTKKMTVQLAKPFVWPEEITDLSP
jgi:large subunit ribosomal protein L23